MTCAQNVVVRSLLLLGEQHKPKQMHPKNSTNSLLVKRVKRKPFRSVTCVYWLHWLMRGVVGTTQQIRYVHHVILQLQMDGEHTTDVGSAISPRRRSRNTSFKD